MFPLLVALLAVLALGDDGVYLSVEEAKAIPKSRSPVPYEGSPMLGQIVHECYYCNNHIHTYFICPFREVLRVKNTDLNDRMAVGLYEGSGESIFRNDVIVSSYTDGYECGNGQHSQCRMEIKCDRSIAAMFEVESINESDPCQTVIIARSPLVCMVAPPPRKQLPSRSEIEGALQTLQEIKQGIDKLTKDMQLLLNRV